MAKGNEAAKGKEKKTGIVTPIFNQSLNRAPNELDTISIDSFDTLPDTIPIDHQIQPAPNFFSSNPPHSPSSRPPAPPQLHHPSFLLLNGFTAEFKVNKNGQKETSDKQIQVDIRYLPIAGSGGHPGKQADKHISEHFAKSIRANPSEQSKPNALRHLRGVTDVGGLRAARHSNRFQSEQQPKFYVLDDLFGETNFKRKRTPVRGGPELRSELFRPGKADFLFCHLQIRCSPWSMFIRRTSVCCEILLSLSFPAGPFLRTKDSPADLCKCAWNRVCATIH